MFEEFEETSAASKWICQQIRFHRVSVIVPAFNSELYIEECLHSLFQQSLHDLEIIVVDDGSTDQTAKIVRSLAPPARKEPSALEQAKWRPLVCTQCWHRFR